jgi:hypothetical protein
MNRISIAHLAVLSATVTEVKSLAMRHPKENPAAPLTEGCDGVPGPESVAMRKLGPLLIILPPALRD